MLFCLNIISAKKSESFYINLVTTNDLHGVLAEQTAGFMNPEYPPDLVGVSGLYQYLNDLRPRLEKEGEGLIILDGGNFFQGNPMGLADSGKTVVKWMNQIGYDALTPGADDFILGAPALYECAKMANFPFLGANLDCSDCPFSDGTIRPYIIKTIKGIRVGILGIITSELEYLASAENLSDIHIGHEVDALKKWIPIMKTEGAEVILVLATNGVPYDREDAYGDFVDSLAIGKELEGEFLNALQMGRYAHGVDVIVAGGVSKGYPLPWYDPSSHVYIIQNYGGGTEFGHIRLKIDRSTHMFTGYETVVDGRVSQTLLADDFSVDPVMHDWIETQNIAALSRIYKHPDWYKIPQKRTGTEMLPGTNFPFDEYTIPSLNDPGKLDVVTWNCEMFPANGDTTIHMLSEIVHDLNADLISFQEIKYPGWFSQLMAYLPEYDYIISKASSYMNQAIVFRRDQFRLVRQIEPFAENDYNFAGRPPLRGDFMYFTNESEVPLSVINLHMKCCDSGLIRRQNAAKMLWAYLNDEMNSGYANFIVMGDWNDDLKDAENAHCFTPFLNDDRFYFPTWEITYDKAQASYPKKPYVSFLDHILVSRSLLPEQKPFTVRTLMVEDYVGGYDVFDDNLSDHRPVYLQFSVPAAGDLQNR